MLLMHHNNPMTTLRTIMLAAVYMSVLAVQVAADDSRYFMIEVLDDETGRGVPLVELETVNHLRFVTDSRGLAAISEPDLMGQTVHFSVASHGYEFPPDGFGFRGKSFLVEPGGKGTLRVERRNLAERLYRVTGSGIYRDTVLSGGKPPIEQPLLNAGVFGSDSVMAALYRGKVHWFWGDTTRPHHPLGANFHISGATSLLPMDGGLDADVGVELDYFVGPRGNVRPVAEMPGEGPTWITSLTVLKDEDDVERMYAGYVKIRNQLESYRWGFVIWDPDTEQFQQVSELLERPPVFLEPMAHSFLHRDASGVEYVYFANPLPLTRVRADRADFLDPSSYEGFTCLQVGTLPDEKQLDRDSDGRLRYGWKVNTPPLSHADYEMLVAAGVMHRDERLSHLSDVESGRAVRAHSGSVYWNDYRRRWVLITVELFGESSILGEVWFAESDRPSGPWGYARKVVTHDKYSFYNPKQHPYFDLDGGQVIFFEGTYTSMFSGNSHPTPRYDYNQVMYRLDLSHPLLQLPVAIYQLPDSGSDSPYTTNHPEGRLAFFALEQPSDDSVPVIWDGEALRVDTDSESDTDPVFHAISADSERFTDTTVPLYEFVHGEENQRVYSTEPDWSRPGYVRGVASLCRVWRVPHRPPDLW
jgi:hypothetical protein